MLENSQADRFCWCWPAAVEMAGKRTSAAEGVRGRLFMARLKPCPSFGSLFLTHLRVSEDFCDAQNGNSNLIWTGLKLSRLFGTGS